uniref:Uncharacterized protein n=1 Tax=Nelumbo nucifera TaxID=4432 RepID=A0A822ZIT0_NELNU|nr:TPA_asm: hypothetical protein HUJ06_003272 [Nelumbo nucifera]
MHRQMKTISIITLRFNGQKREYEQIIFLCFQFWATNRNQNEEIQEDETVQKPE